MVLALTDPLVQSYLLYTGILAIKILLMIPLTARQRYTKKVFVNEEDAKFRNGVVKFGDPDVERVRRAHQNDLENIPVFWVLSAIYLTTGPSAWLATMLLRTYTVARIFYTIFYAVKPLPQPARAITFITSTLISSYMGIMVVLYYISAL